MASHPMVPVPQAIMRVLSETAAMMIQRGPQTETISICSSSSSSSAAAAAAAAAAAQDMHIHVVGRISAVDIRASELGYPTYNASIMDGYAIDIDEVTRISLTTTGHHHDHDHGDDSWQFHVKDRVYAGPTPDTETVTECVRVIDIDMADYTKSLPKTVYVTTGAVIPPSYNAVIPVEQVDESEMLEHGIISIPYSALVSARRNPWIRPIGCDIKPHTPILKKGDVIEPVHIGLLVQCGVEVVEVTCLPSVGILSTGNELYSHTRKGTGTGTIPDANGPVLCSLLAKYGNCRPRYLGIARDDDEEALTTKLRDSIMEHDVIITTGGISMGEMDIIEKVLVKNLGCDIHFGRLNMKPGKPTTFLTTKTNSKTRLIFAMPGNPVSAMVCTELLIRPCLDMMHTYIHDYMGTGGGGITNMVNNALVHAEVKAILRKGVKLDTSRPEYHRVKLEYTINHDGNLELYAKSTGVQRSSRLMSMLHADGLMMLPRGVKGGKDRIDDGESYTVLLSRRGCQYGGIGVFDGIAVKDSLHLGRCVPTVGLLEIIGSRAIASKWDAIEERVRNIFGSSEHAYTLLESKASNLLNYQETLQEMSHCLNIILVVGVDLTFIESIDMASYLKTLICKPADSMAFMLRQGAANDDPIAALVDSVAGWTVIYNRSCLLVGIPSDGLEGSINAVAPLLKEALYKGRGGR